MVVIRLARGGDKKNPFYRIMVADKRARRDGRFIEQLGFYDPMARGQAEPIKLDAERLAYWQGVGAQMSDRVKSLVKKHSKEGLKAAPSMNEQKKVQAEKTIAMQKEKLAAAAKDAEASDAGEAASAE